MNSTITTNKEDYKKHFTPNTVNWLESRGFDPEKIYKALNKENIDLNSIEKKLVSQKEKILQYNSKTGKWYKPVGVQDNLRNTIKTTAVRTDEIKEPKLIPIPVSESENKKMRYIEIGFKDVMDFYNHSRLGNACASFVKATLNVNGYAVPETTKTDIDAWHMGQSLKNEGFKRVEPKNINSLEIENLPVGTVFLIRHPTSKYRKVADEIEGKGNGFTHAAVIVEIKGEKKIADFKNGKVYITEIDKFTDTSSRNWYNLNNTKLIMVPDIRKRSYEIAYDKNIKGQTPSDLMWDSFKKNTTNAQYAAAAVWSENERRMAATTVTKKKSKFNL